LQKGKKYKKQAIFMYLQKNAPRLTFRAFLDKEARCSRSDTNKKSPPLALNLTHKIEHFPIAVEGVEFLQIPPNCFYTGRTVAWGPSGTACILHRFPCRVRFPGCFLPSVRCAIQNFPFVFAKQYAALYRSNSVYSASACKVITDTGSFFKTSFGRIFGCAENRALRGFRRLRGRSAPLQSLAQLRCPPLAATDCIQVPQGVSMIPMIDTLVTDFELMFSG
jgi:hypothetical protein